MAGELLSLPEEILSKICKAYFNSGWSAKVETWEGADRKLKSEMHTIESVGLLLVNKQLNRIAREALHNTYDGSLILKNALQAMRNTLDWQKVTRFSEEVIRQQTTMILAKYEGGVAIGLHLHRKFPSEPDALIKHFEQLKRVTIFYLPYTCNHRVTLTNSAATLPLLDNGFVSHILKLSPYRRLATLVYEHTVFTLEIIVAYKRNLSRKTNWCFHGYRRLTITEVVPLSSDPTEYVPQNYTFGDFHKVSTEDELWYHVQHGSLEGYVAPVEEEYPY